jgi:hypothetical protein
LEVGIEKLALNSKDEHLLVLQIFDTLSGCGDMDCLKHSEMVGAKIWPVQLGRADMGTVPHIS